MTRLALMTAIALPLTTLPSGSALPPPTAALDKPAHTHDHAFSVHGPAARLVVTARWFYATHQSPPQVYPLDLRTWPLPVR
jgi:hypothetical protein